MKIIILAFLVFTLNTINAQNSYPTFFEENLTLNELQDRGLVLDHVWTSENTHFDKKIFSKVLWKEKVYDIYMLNDSLFTVRNVIGDLILSNNLYLVDRNQEVKRDTIIEHRYDEYDPRIYIYKYCKLKKIK